MRMAEVFLYIFRVISVSCKIFSGIVVNARRHQFSCFLPILNSRLYAGSFFACFLCFLFLGGAEER